MSLSCEKVSSYSDMDLLLFYINTSSTDFLKKMVDYIQSELKNRQKEFDNETCRSE